MKTILNKVYKGTQANFYKILRSNLKNNEKKFIITVNPETIMQSKNDVALKKMLLDDKNYLVPDGIAVVKACQKLDISIKERIPGIDIVSYLLEEGNKQKKSIYLFGSKEQVINKLVEKIEKKYPNLKILGYSNGYVKNKDNIFKDITKLQPDICLVALGIPEQEKLIYKHIDKFTKGIFVGVGGSFDVLSGSKKRAPKIFIKLNLEWLYRIAKEPKRLKRFWNNNIKFLMQIKK